MLIKTMLLAAPEKCNDNTDVTKSMIRDVNDYETFTIAAFHRDAVFY